jgi:hypothetical protein
MPTFHIVNTDNFGGDYPNESFVENLPPLTDQFTADKLCMVINQVAHMGHGEAGGPRNFKVVSDGYKLQPGFEP